MSKNHYKVFFTMSFLYRIDSKKKVSKSFKSDLDINDKLLNQSLDDNNVHAKWKMQQDRIEETLWVFELNLDNMDIVLDELIESYVSFEREED